MDDAPKMIEAHSYATLGGNVPVLEWIRALARARLAEVKRGDR